MPSRNIVKLDSAESFYHVYSRGVNKSAIFRDDEDRYFFLGLFERYLSRKPARNNAGELYPHYYGSIELLAFCLMDNHFHLLVYQKELSSLSAFMRSLVTSYSRYFNHKYKRTGPLFESRYKASLIEADSYLQHISRYIHLNPRYWQRYEFSSLAAYTKASNDSQDWLTTKRILELFESRQQYMDFVAAYADRKEELDEIKHALADS